MTEGLQQGSFPPTDRESLPVSKIRCNHYRKSIANYQNGCAWYGTTFKVSRALGGVLSTAN